MYTIRMIAWTLAIFSVILLSSCAGNKIDKPEGKPLSGIEISKLIVGNTVNGAIGAQTFSFYYKNSVSVSGVIGTLGDDGSGTWKIKDEITYCNEWDSFFDGVQRCYQWYKTERGYILENVDAYHLRPIVVYEIKAGNPLGF